MIHLFWDVDGTLLSTARAGVFALEDAAREVLGGELDLATMRTAGLTDAEIAVEICRSFREEERAGDFLRAYARLLPEALGRRQGEVLPNVRANLEAMDARDDVVNLLLTGNVREGAEAKLRHYGLWDFFADTGGAFCVEGSDRPSIARAARGLVEDAYVPDHVYVIGDTPHDISCGKAIGARTVAVATGPSYSLMELKECEPWLALEALPAPTALNGALGIPNNSS
ncbi:MAG: haloacid dehalogenase-like hydrolase [Acidobacteriota bacterium]|nr:haloacid dehalogenase-like hydrolase [Acidobacteriota bacterium]